MLSTSQKFGTDNRNTVHFHTQIEQLKHPFRDRNISRNFSSAIFVNEAVARSRLFERNIKK